MSIRKAPSAKYSALSSSCGTIFTQMVMVPCETIKIQLQIFQKVKVRGESPLRNSIRFIYRNEGFFGFWRGYFVSLSCSLPSCAIYYAIFETLRKDFYQRCEGHSTLAHFIPAISSSIGQVCTCLCTSPIDRFRTQYWADRNQKVSSLLKATFQQVRNEGVRCLYHGLKPLIIRDIFFSSVYWSCFEEIRSAVGSLGVAPVFQNLVAGSIGGMATSAFVTPFDLVKTRQQVLHTKEGILHSLKDIYHMEGFRGMFRGLTPRMIQSMPTMATMMIVYDAMNRFWMRRNPEFI